MQPSRRAFLLGRPAPRTPWQIFCQRLRRACEGELVVIVGDAPATPTSLADSGPQARWTPVDDLAVRQARALCAEHAVQLALDGSAVSTDGRPVLWVDPGRLNRLASEPGPRQRWRAGPGVTLGELARMGLQQFARHEPGRTLAAWFADRGAASWPCGRGDLSGVYAADVLLADGVADTLGPFGEVDGQPLRSAALQQLVPGLFRLASGPEAQWCRTRPDWPARYRLDALLPTDPATLNLAQLLHGHGGTLAWVESLVLLPVDGAGIEAVPDPCAPPAQARALDARVKSNFDPGGVFPDLAR